jgi:1,4-alpha-glucan branching enzyme
MRLIRPSLFLFAEDYSNWGGMTQPSLNGDGVGFDATWYGDFHHNLIEHRDGDEAHLVQEAGYGDGRSLHMSYFAGALASSGGAKVVYNESHDDCGNRPGSARTLVLAVDYAPLIGDTRKWAEARVRFAAAMTLLSAATPMFFMGEEVGAQRPYRYDDFLANREDILGLAEGDGAALMAFYRDLIALSQSSGGIRSRNIDVIHAHDDNRVIGFLRWDDAQTFFVAGSLATAAFTHGYRFSSPRFDDAEWTQVLNSDLGIYGGWGVGNGAVRSSNGMLEIVLPASGAVVMKRSP